MTLSEEEIQKLQEELILIYKTVRQSRMANAFYFEDIEAHDKSSKLINKINELPDPEDTLKRCIIELEEIKVDKKLKLEDFNEIMDEYDIGFLKRKYYIKDIRDMDNLDVDDLLSML